jgi:hypothetical protein
MAWRSLPLLRAVLFSAPANRAERCESLMRASCRPSLHRCLKGSFAVPLDLVFGLGFLRVWADLR